MQKESLKNLTKDWIGKTISQEQFYARLSVVRGIHLLEKMRNGSEMNAYFYKRVQRQEWMRAHAELSIGSNLIMFCSVASCEEQVEKYENLSLLNYMGMILSFPMCKEHREEFNIIKLVTR